MTEVQEKLLEDAFIAGCRETFQHYQIKERSGGYTDWFNEWNKKRLTIPSMIIGDIIKSARNNEKWMIVGFLADGQPILKPLFDLESE